MELEAEEEKAKAKQVADDFFAKKADPFAAANKPIPQKGERLEEEKEDGSYVAPSEEPSDDACSDLVEDEEPEVPFNLEEYLKVRDKL